ncbi:MAG: sugar transferase [Actinobacteria bacterium]|nr:sugar transferase [Actinomycetota bacterium]
MARPTPSPKLVLALTDLIVVALAAFTASALHGAEAVSSGVPGRATILTLIALPAWALAFSHQRLYNIRFLGRRIDEVRRLFDATLIGTASVVGVSYLNGRVLSRSEAMALFASAFVLLMIEREGARRIFASLRARGDLLRPAVIVGSGPEACEIAGMLHSDPTTGYRVVGFLDDSPTEMEPLPGLPVLGRPEQACSALAGVRGGSVIVTPGALTLEGTNRLVRKLLEQGLHVELSPNLRDIAAKRLVVHPVGRFPLVYLEPVQRNGWRATAKRLFDIVGGALGLLATAPLLGAAAVAIKLDSAGQVLFRQQRLGRDGRVIRILKLRTMVADAEDRLEAIIDLNEADGPLFKLRDDPRVTRVGRFLRRASIDELPQLWNVLRGEMSLVGPRPALPREAELWDDQTAQRLRVNPGLTGMWQVNGRSETSFEDYSRLDLYYVDNWSLLCDLTILLKTVPVVLARRGAA